MNTCTHSHPLDLCVSPEGKPVVFATNSLQRRKKGLGLAGLRTTNSGSTHSKNKQGLLIGLPQNFRQISSIIDVDILPETHRRVRLHKHGTHKPLGFYIRDGVSVRVTAQGVEKVSYLSHIERMSTPATMTRFCFVCVCIGDFNGTVLGSK